jgi:carbon-monoxide dehydrogenase medium subunit
MMTMPRYHRPGDVAEAVEALGSQERTAALAGGTDLMNDLRLGLFHPTLVVDTAGLAELRAFSFDDGAVLGAGTTMASLSRTPEIRRRYPALSEAAALLGGRQMQTVATVGGNLCHASPAAETATPLLVHDAVAVVAGPGGRREVPLGEFWRGPRATCLAAGELLVELRIPESAGNSAYRRLELRRSVDIAIVSASVRLTHDGATITGARVALGAVAPVPLRIPAAEEALVGAEIADDARLRTAVAAAADICRSAARPIDDTRASARYRASMVEVVAARCIDAVLNGLVPSPDGA